MCVNDILHPNGFRNLSSEKLLEIILYGHDKLSNDSNAKILALTIRCIHDSKSFDRITDSNSSECS